MFLGRTAAPAPLALTWRKNRNTRKLTTFALIGVTCTVAFACIFSALRHVTGPLGANFGALTATAGLNFAANRRLTFGVRGGSLAAQATGYGAVYLFGLVASSAVLWAALETFDHPEGRFELLLALGASAVATVLRYLMLNRWVFPEPARA